MINVSNEFRQLLANDKRKYKIKLDITLKDGTALSVLNDQIWENGFSISDATSGDNSFDIGSVISKKMVVNLKNMDKAFSQYDFYDAEVVAWVGLELSDGSIEYLRKCTVSVDEPLENESSMNLECLDYLAKFDRPYSDSTLVYPATLSQIVVDACSVCGVVLLSADFPNSDYLVSERPNDEAITFRDIIGYAAQIAGSYAKADSYGRLFFGWYDTEPIVAPYIMATSASEPIVTSDSELLAVLVKATSLDYVNDNIYSDIHRIVALSSQEIALSDTLITGVAVSDSSSEEKKTYLYGEEGYVLYIDNNKLIQGGKEEEAAQRIGPRIAGMKFRKMNISCLSDPSMEAGDRAYIIDRKKNVYLTYITSTNFKPGSYQQVSCSAETPSKKNSTRYDSATKVLADSKKNTRDQISDYNLAVQSLTSLITQSLGLFKSEEVLEDKSVIFYMHNKPTLAESQTIWKMTADAFAVSTDGGKTWNAGMDSEGNAVVNILSAIGIRFDWARGGTLTLGGYDNINGVIRIMDQDGKEVGLWNNGGLIAKSTIDISDYTSDDMTRMQNIIVGTITPTSADYDRLDVNNDGRIDVYDMLMVQRILNGVTSGIYDVEVAIKPTNSKENITIVLIDKETGAVEFSLSLGRGGINATSGTFSYCTSVNYFAIDANGATQRGASGTFTSADGKTITVTKGIITSIA